MITRHKDEKDTEVKSPLVKRETYKNSHVLFPENPKREHVVQEVNVNVTIEQPGDDCATGCMSGISSVLGFNK